MSLSDLSKELPSDDDLLNYVPNLVKESDRGAAVMAAALVERALEDAIRSRLASPEDGTADTWFDGTNAPFRTFAAKISLGRAIGIYGKRMHDRLGVIKSIRNAFAHRSLPLDFSHPLVAEACLKLTFGREKYKGEKMRVIFGGTCVALATVLGRHAEANGGKEIDVTFL